MVCGTPVRVHGQSDRGQCLVGLVCSVLSCYMTLKGCVNGDAVSHAVMPGVVLAYILKIPFAIGGALSLGGVSLVCHFRKEGGGQEGKCGGRKVEEGATLPPTR